ncbi:MAG: glycosyltransferase family 39 protein, partial [Magnetospirillum sp.]|nr:glycosyltransferase family 39 protein [Magnetospirillum sp.]
RLLFVRRGGAGAAVVWAPLPAVSLSSLIVTTAPFLLLFWAAALVCLIEAARRGAAANRWWLLLGVSLGLGLLAKYAMLLFAASVALWLVWEPAQRRLLRGAGLWLAVAVAALILAPNLLWNALNGFVTVAHTRDNANLGGELGNPAKLGEFLASQVAVVGPVVMAALVAALAGALAAPRRASAAVRLLAAFVLPVLTLMTVEAFLSRANANWSAPAYVAGTVLAVAALARWGRWALPLAVAVNLSAAVVLYNFDVLAPRLGVPSRIDPAKRLKGWPEVGARVSAHLAAHPGARLLADERKVLATLTYYVRPHPFDAVKWNPSGRIHDHFDQTTRLEPGAGPLIYVGEWRDVAETIAPDFTTARHIEDIRIPLPAGDRVVTVWLFDGFKGY